MTWSVQICDEARDASVAFRNQGHTWEAVAELTNAPSAAAASMMARRYAAKHQIPLRLGRGTALSIPTPPKKRPRAKPKYPTVSLTRKRKGPCAICGKRLRHQKTSTVPIYHDGTALEAEATAAAQLDEWEALPLVCRDCMRED